MSNDNTTAQPLSATYPAPGRTPSDRDGERVDMLGSLGTIVGQTEISGIYRLSVRFDGTYLGVKEGEFKPSTLRTARHAIRL